MHGLRPICCCYLGCKDREISNGESVSLLSAISVRLSSTSDNSNLALIGSICAIDSAEGRTNLRIGAARNRAEGNPLTTESERAIGPHSAQSGSSSALRRDFKRRNREPGNRSYSGINEARDKKRTSRELRRGQCPGGPVLIYVHARGTPIRRESERASERAREREREREDTHRVLAVVNLDLTLSVKQELISLYGTRLLHPRRGRLE